MSFLKALPPIDDKEISFLFQINHHFDDVYVNHTYVIEKEWNVNENAYLYRIHHSYAGKFTLGQWEETDPWTFSSELQHHHYIKYYTQFRGRQLTLAEIKEFIEQENKFVKNGFYKIEASMYPIDNQKLQKLEILLEAQRKNDQKREKNTLTSQSYSSKTESLLDSDQVFFSSSRNRNSSNSSDKSGCLMM